MCEASNFEEPRAVVPHAGICTGAAGQLAVLPLSIGLRISEERIVNALLIDLKSISLALLAFAQWVLPMLSLSPAILNAPFPVSAASAAFHGKALEPELHLRRLTRIA